MATQNHKEKDFTLSETELTKQTNESHRIKGIIEERYINIATYINPDTWDNFFKFKKHKPACAIGLVNYLALMKEGREVGAFLHETARQCAAFFQDELDSHYSNRNLINALSNVFTNWVKEKKVVMYNSFDQFLVYLYVLVRVNLEVGWILKKECKEIAAEEVDQSYEELLNKSGGAISGGVDNEVFPRGSKPSKASTLSGDPTIIVLKGEEETVDLIDGIRLLESLNSEELPVWRFYLEGYTEREISEKTLKPKTTVHDQIVRIKNQLR